MRTFYKTDRALVDEFVADIEAAYAIDSITGEPIAVKDSALSSEWPDIVMTYEKARAAIGHRTPDTLRDAAPELLAALQIAKHYADCCDMATADEKCREDLAVINAAIAKALGHE